MKYLDLGTKGPFTMTYYSLLTEFVALLLTVILLLSLTLYRKVNTRSLKVYRICLILTISSIVWDMISVVLLQEPGQVFVGLNLLVNTIYFMMVVCTCSVTVLYIFEKMLEHVYEQYCMTRGRRILFGLTIFYAVLILMNFKTGIIFYFDQEGRYHRGVLNESGYLFMVIEMGMLLVCYYRHSSGVGKEMRQALRVLVPVVLALAGIQLIDQDLLLNGIIAAFVDTILFFCFLCQGREDDNVTGIGNRDGFFSELYSRIRGQQKFQILLVFPQDFGAINQRYGYQIGNEFLYSIASWIENAFPEAKAFRYVGVSFAVIVPYKDKNGAQRYVREFQRRFEFPWIVGWRREIFNASLSDFIYTEKCAKEYKEENQMMAMLDYMLSITKHSGQKYLSYDEKVSVGFVERRRIVDCIRQAIQEKQFEVWYQPVYFPEESAFISAEALVRLRDSEGRFIPPDQFIPIAEEVGNVGEIFWQVLEEVCSFIKENPELPLHTISINLSMKQFEEQELPVRIHEILKEWGVSPEKIKFEITERVISADAMQADEIIHQMEQEGFRFCLDDFGIGYSNFASVVRYQFECIKFDRSFVKVVEEEEEGRKVIRGMISLFHEIGMEVIAEGTETWKQVQLLRDLGADKIQGFYYAKPMDALNLQKFLKNK